MKRFFGSLGRLFRGSGELRQGLEHRGTGVQRQDVEPEPHAEVPCPYKKGSLIGHRYEFKESIGAGGFGVVYLVYMPEFKVKLALKTFQDKYLADAEARDRFRKECEIWANMGPHPYLVQAYFIDELSGRLYIPMEYIAPKRGLNSLEGYLIHRPPDLAQSLRWAIQFCHGMEYAHSSKDFAVIGTSSLQTL